MEQFYYNSERAKTDWEFLQDCISDDSKTYGDILSKTFFEINDLLDNENKTEEEDLKLLNLYAFLDFLMQNPLQVKEFMEAVSKLSE